MDCEREALLQLGELLKSQDYRFTAITPLTHSRVQKRTGSQPATTLADVFGWNRPFRVTRDFSRVAELLKAANELEERDGLLRSRVRFSTLGQQLYVHSSYPTSQDDAVFFGPDTYRFARALRQFMPALRDGFRVVDIGCGSGAGAIFVCATAGRVNPRAVLVDINEKALRYSRVNVALSGVPMQASFVNSDLFDEVDGKADLIICNPPYLVDPARRAYRHGGERGFDLSLRIVEQGLARLSPGGRLILYTGTPVVEGVDRFFEALASRFEDRAPSFLYEEIDPDVFGEELEAGAYQSADRIAAVCLVADAGENNAGIGNGLDRRSGRAERAEVPRLSARPHQLQPQTA
jgi:methylase of polypeptide subunit release factors